LALFFYVGNREQGIGNREQGTGNREQGTGNREQGTGNRELYKIKNRGFNPLVLKSYNVLCRCTLMIFRFNFRD
jgi:hypothetical protein